MLVDYKCSGCGRIEEKNIKGFSQEPQFCTLCDSPMIKQLSAPSFNIKGYSYKNSYSNTNKTNKE
jgi:predicted nucleic acid-binding Zn ribbon protein